MAIGKEELIFRVQEKLRPFRSDSVIPARIDDIESLIDEGCHKLAMTALDNRGRRRQLTKNYAATAFSATGTIDLTAATFADLLIEGVDGSCTLTSSVYTENLDWFPDEANLQFGEPYIGIPRWTVERNSIITKVRTGDTALDASATGTLKNAIFIPVVALSSGSTTLPIRLEEELVDIIAQLQLKRGMVEDESGSSGESR